MSHGCFLMWNSPESCKENLVSHQNLRNSCDKFIIAWYKYMRYTQWDSEDGCSKKKSLKPFRAIFLHESLASPRSTLVSECPPPLRKMAWISVPERFEFAQNSSPLVCFLSKVFVQERWQYLALPNFKKMAMKQNLPQNVHLQYFPKTILTTNQYGRKHRGQSVIH